MIVLGIESSCDETSVAVVKDGSEILSNIISSQIDIHAKYGGVVPELASRHHIQQITVVLEQALEQAGVTFDDIDEIHVTKTPGLIGSLLIGINAAEVIGAMYNIPVKYKDHIVAHVMSAHFTKPIEYPMLSLVVSGGHTQLMYFKQEGEYEIIGRTNDDAVGEAYDKVAKMLGLPYPGGPIIDKLANEGENVVPMPNIKVAEYDFSFSGLKGHMNRIIKEDKYSNEDIACSFQEKVASELFKKIDLARRNYDVKYVSIVGGVSANSKVRTEAIKRGIVLPDLSLSGDNAAMITK